jgi:uncharacterized protein YbjQ (UPF0145 family)
MQYYIKPKKREQGPYTKEQLVKMLGSLKIGRKTPCRPDDGSATRMFPLEKVVPEVVEAIQKQRGKAKKARREESGLRKEPLGERIMVTTETALHDLTIDERLTVVTAEVAIGLNVFKDVFTVARDIIGGRSKTIQNAFSEARDTVLKEMRREADKMGAQAIIGVDFKYNEISSGRSMLLMVGVGTAVTLEEEDAVEEDTDEDA